VNVLTIGTFDGLHVGHLELLRESRAIAGDGRLVVGLNDDAFVERYKGRCPVHPFAHRRELIEALGMVDAVVANAGGEDARPCIEVVAPDLLTIGDDWLDQSGSGAPDEGRYFAQLGVTARWMAERGLRVVYVPRTRGVSSRELRRVPA